MWEEVGSLRYESMREEEYLCWLALELEEWYEVEAEMYWELRGQVVSGDVKCGPSWGLGMSWMFGEARYFR
jgi:hypothetical protein